MIAHFFILYIVHSGLFTPPFCPTAYVASGIAKANPFRIGFQSMRLGVVVYLIPIIIVFNPSLVLIGTPGEIAVTMISALIGVLSLAIGLEGYLFSQTNWLQRLLFTGGGILMVIPGTLTDFTGVGVLALAILWQWRSSKVLKM